MPGVWTWSGLSSPAGTRCSTSATVILAAVAIIGPTAGVITGSFGIASSVTGGLHTGGGPAPIPSPDYYFETTIGDLSSNTLQQTFTAGFDTGLDTILGDWNKLSIIGPKITDTSQAGFQTLYDQMLPEHSGGVLMTAHAASVAVSQAVAAPLGIDPGAGRGVWAHEVVFDLSRDAQDAQGFKSHGFGLAAGADVQGEHNALGANLAFMTSGLHDRTAAAGEELSMNYLGAGVYWRFDAGWPSHTKPRGHRRNWALATFTASDSASSARSRAGFHAIAMSSACDWPSAPVYSRVMVVVGRFWAATWVALETTPSVTSTANMT